MIIMIGNDVQMSLNNAKNNEFYFSAENNFFSSLSIQYLFCRHVFPSIYSVIEYLCKTSGIPG